MARLWPANGHPTLGVDRDRERARCAGGYILRLEGRNVYFELRTRRLGDSRACSLTSAAESGRDPSRFFVRYMDISDTHLLELC